MKSKLMMNAEDIARLFSMVGSPLIVISELIKNSIDANATEIKISVLAEDGIIRIEDDGDGFSLNDIVGLSKPGFSSKKKDGNNCNASGSFFTGSKGLGMLSVFSLCEQIEIQTKSVTDGEYQILMEKGSGEYSYTHHKTEINDTGTIVTMIGINKDEMALLCLESEVKKLKQISTYLYKKSVLNFPKLFLSINRKPFVSMQYDVPLDDLLYDSEFSYDKDSSTLTFQCKSSSGRVNSSPISISNFGASEIGEVITSTFGVDIAYLTRMNNDIEYSELENISGVPSFEGRIVVNTDKNNPELKKYGQGVTIYVNEFALYNYLSATNDWLDLSDFSQRTKYTYLMPHNVFGFINIPSFVEANEKLEISNERADFIQNATYKKFTYLIKSVIIRILLCVDVYERKMNKGIKAGILASPKTEDQTATTQTTDSDVSSASGKGVAALEMFSDAYEFYTYNDVIILEKLIKSAFYSSGQSVANSDVKICVDNVEKREIGSEVNACNRTVVYSFADMLSGTLISKRVLIRFSDPCSSVSGKMTHQNLINYPGSQNYKVDFSPTVSNLVNQINDLNAKGLTKYKDVIACSLRTIFELCIDGVLYNSSSNSKILELQSKICTSKLLEEKVKDVITFLGEKDVVVPMNTQILSIIAGKLQISYKSLNNRLNASDYESAVRRANLATHKASQMVSLRDIEDLGSKIGCFIVVVNEVIRIE